MVDPANLNPLFFRSLLMTSDMSVLAGISLIDSQRFRIGLPSTNRQIYLSNIKESIPKTRNECPSPKQLLRLFRGKKSKKGKTKIIDHITSCYHCAHEFEFILKALRYEREMNQVTKRFIETKKIKVLPSRLSWRFTSVVAGISVVCIWDLLTICVYFIYLDVYITINELW